MRRSDLETQTRESSEFIAAKAQRMFQDRSANSRQTDGIPGDGDGSQCLLSGTLTAVQTASPVLVDRPLLSTVDLSGRFLSAIPKTLRIQ